MSLAQLAALALCGWAAEPDPAPLIAKLSSPREAVRTEAAGALEELGRPALPALYRVRDSRDADLRERVSKVIDLIERQRLLRATKVRLDFDDTPLPEAVESLRAQAGFPITLAPDDALRAKRVSLRASEPVPLWEAIDRLGAAGGARHNPGIPWVPGAREPAVLLAQAEGPPVPVSDNGPFRVYLVRLARHREVRPARKAGDTKSRESLNAELLLCAEPGLAVNPVSPVAVEEAKDDHGRNLRLGSATPSFHPHLRSPRFEEAHAGLLALQVPLEPTSEPGSRLRTLKGRVRALITTRTGDPIVIPLIRTEGRTFSKGGVELAVTGLQRTGETTSLRLTIRGERAERNLMPQPDVPLGDYQPPYWVEDHLQVQDDQGKPLWCNATFPKDTGDGAVETNVTVYKGQDNAPARLVYYGVVGASTEIPFEFNDLPLP